MSPSEPELIPNEGVAPVSADDLRSAYRKLALQHHPDRGGVAAVFVRVTDAYNLARTFLKETRP